MMRIALSASLALAVSGCASAPPHETAAAHPIDKLVVVCPNSKIEITKPTEQMTRQRFLCDAKGYVY